MTLHDLLTYVDIEGSLIRRGTFVPPDPPDIITMDFESIALAATLGTNPAGVNAFRQIVADPDYGYDALQHDHMAIVDLGGAEDHTIRIRYDNGWYQSATDNGIAYQPDLPRAVDAIRVTSKIRFNSGFVSGKGGKFAPGVGWSNRHRGPASGGSATQPHSGSFRWMWRDALRMSPYVYDANGTNGIGMATTPTNITTMSDNAFHILEMEVVMNTALVDSGPLTVPSTAYVAPTVVQGVDYQADGRLTMKIDGVTIYNATNRVNRKYSDTHITHLTWSWFRGGGDATWDVTGAPFYMDMAEYEVIEL